MAATHSSLQRACRRPDELRRGRARRSTCLAAASPQRETDPKKRVVITGMGIASVFGNDPATFYDSLLAGKSGITMIDRFDTSDYPTRFAGQIKGFECATP
jgi:3-oxoacyl-[acyl-carrier-protein] synthase II